MSATKFLESIDVPVIPTAPSKVKNGGAILKRFLDGPRKGQCEIWLSKEHPVGSSAAERILWHEAGHLIDNARSLLGRATSNFRSALFHGDRSFAAREVLARNNAFITSRRPFSAIVRLRDGRRVRADQVATDPTITLETRSRLAPAIAAARAQHRRYVEQDIELFAEGFALYMTARTEMESEAPELVQIFRAAAAAHGLA